MSLDVNGLILKELDRQHISGKLISFLLKKLELNETKFKFLNYLLENRNIILTSKDLVKEIEKLI